MPGPAESGSCSALTKEQLHSFGSAEVQGSWWPCTAHPAQLPKTWTGTQLKKMQRMDSGKAWRASNLLQLLLLAPAMEPYYVLLREQTGPQHVLLRVCVVENKSRLVNKGWASMADLLVKVGCCCRDWQL